MHDAQVRTGLLAPPSAHVPEVAARGFYLAARPGGFVLHMSASATHISQMRERVFKEVCGAGAGEDTADAARLVASELVANAVRLCGPFTPVVVQVTGLPDRVLVYVHDPEPALVPRKRHAPPSNAEFESGRGLWILDVLAPGWTVEPSPVGKQIRCRVPYSGSTCA